MKQIFKVLLIFLFMLPIFAGSDQDLQNSQKNLKERTKEWQKNNPTSLPHWMTEEEQRKMDSYQNRYFYETAPPTGPARNIAEYEPMEGVLIRYPLGIPLKLVKEMAEDARVYTLVANNYQKNKAKNSYSSQGVKLSNCHFVMAPTDSYWTRDYSPWFIIDGNNQMGIINFRYNRPRPHDDDIPIKMAQYLNMELYGMNVVHTGGNYMTDGKGISASTTIVYTESSSQQGISQSKVDKRMKDYLGVKTYHVVKDPNGTYIDHIDCWAKYLAVDKILIRKVPSYHSQYYEIEKVVNYFKSKKSAYGTAYKIYRINTPGNEPYTNSLILNNKVFVPLTGSSNDNAAISTYKNAMPGYEIHGIKSYGWQSTDALHCRTKGIPDRNMLSIKHIPISGIQPQNSRYQVEAKIISYGRHVLKAQQLKLFYKVNDSGYQSVLLEPSAIDTYSATITVSPGDSKVAYYLQAEDASGKVSYHPYMGKLDPHTFSISTFEADISPALSPEAVSETAVSFSWANDCRD